jgi:hypothetical protein
VRPAAEENHMRIKRRPPHKPPIPKTDEPPPEVKLALEDFQDDELAADLYQRILRAQAMTRAKREKERQKHDAA